MARLFLIWIVIALALIGMWGFLHYPVPQTYRNEFLALKLGLLGVLAAVSTFQSEFWHGLAYRQINQLHVIVIALALIGD